MSWITTTVQYDSDPYGEGRARHYLAPSTSPLTTTHQPRTRWYNSQEKYPNTHVIAVRLWIHIFLSDTRKIRRLACPPALEFISRVFALWPGRVSPALEPPRKIGGRGRGGAPNDSQAGFRALVYRPARKDDVDRAPKEPRRREAERGRKGLEGRVNTARLSKRREKAVKLGIWRVSPAAGGGICLTVLVKQKRKDKGKREREKKRTFVRMYTQREFYTRKHVFCICFFVWLCLFLWIYIHA